MGDNEKMLKEIFEEYDAFFVENKYGEGTHKKQFDTLKEVLKDDEMSMRALNWIHDCYDCYYKDEHKNHVDKTKYNERSAFYYLQNKLSSIGQS